MDDDDFEPLPYPLALAVRAGKLATFAPLTDPNPPDNKHRATDNKKHGHAGPKEIFHE